MSEATRLLFFAGSARSGSFNKKVAQLGARIAEANGTLAVLLSEANRGVVQTLTRFFFGRR